MKKVLLLLMVIISFSACSKEKQIIKSSLKESIAKETLRDYKFIDYRIKETILKCNLEDSINDLMEKISIFENYKWNDSIKMNEYYDHMIKCLKERITTLSWLKSSYDRMVESDIKAINMLDANVKTYDSINNVLNIQIKEYEQMIEDCNDLIIYYIIEHKYSINKQERINEVKLNSDYKYISIIK